MSQTPLLVTALKRALKNHGKTYLDVASYLGMSEASVKRMFSTNSFTLQRLESVCHFIDLDLIELAKQAEGTQKRISHLTEEQEQKLVSNTELMLVAVCVRNNWQFDDIVKNYAISETDCIKHLATLDKLKLIELLPGNRVKLLIRPDFRWLPGGPIERFYRDNIQREFFASNFSKPDEERLFLTASLSRGSAEQLLVKLNRLANEFAELHRDDMNLPVENKVNIGLVLACRPWELAVFSALKK